jgi:hypothetical protein
MNLVHNNQWENPPWEEPESDAASRAALDRLLAEWAQPLSAIAATPIQCPGCGRTAGGHALGCDFSWLHLPQTPDPAPEGPSPH